MTLSCLFCKSSDGKLTALTRKGLETILKASKSRQDNLYLTLDVQHCTEYYIHNNCRALYNNARNIAKCVAAIRADGNIHDLDVISASASKSVSAEPEVCLPSASTAPIRLDTETNALIGCTSGSVQVDDPVTDSCCPDVFEYTTHCFLCTKLTSQNRRQEVSVVKKCVADEISDYICANSVELDDLNKRISGVDLSTVSATYHRKCYKIFRLKMRRARAVSVTSNCVTEKVTTAEDAIDEASSYQEVVVAGSELALSVLQVTDCGRARSHEQYLRNVAMANGLEYLVTIGGGNCFFDAVHLALLHHGMQRTVQELREVAAIELEINRHIYEALYQVEDHGQHEQATTYESFIDRTRRGSEWATELTVCAMARGLDMVIRVVSTVGSNVGHLTAFAKDYDDGVVHRDRVVTVGYNAAEGHYIGLRSLSVPAVTNVESAGQRVPFRSVSRKASIVQEPMSLGSISSVMDQDDVEPTAMSIGSISGLTVQEADKVIADDADDVFSEDVGERVATHGRNDTSMSIGSEPCLDGHECQQGSQIQCDNCRRSETDKCRLQLKLYTGKFVLRRIRLLPADSVEYVLCESCHVYLREKISPSKLWCHGWPSVIVCLLTLCKFSHLRSEVWNMLPPIHRQCWRFHATTLGLTTEVNTPSLFQDFTADYERYSVLIKSGKISDFMCAMSDFAFPCVKCPAGCFAYVDECKNVSFNHYLDWKFGLTFFNGQGRYLKGAREDWPITSLQLGTFKVTPGLMVDAEQGLCFMMCATHGKGLLHSIVHVPRNPVLGDLGFQIPDTCAAAVLTPNVIRAGRMGRWTNSSHVVTAIGGYTGISSSSIAEKYDCTFHNERLGTACTLAMRHRPDIYEVCQNRLADMPGGDEELNRVLSLYDVLDKPSGEEVNSSLVGASSVDIHHSFLMNDRMFRRDTRYCENDSNDRQLQSWLLALTFVHPPTANGCAPVNLSSFYNVEKHALTGALLHLLVHCPCFHEVLLHCFEINREDYVRKLLKFAQYCAGQASNCSGIRNANECEEATRAELVKRRLPMDNKCVSLVKLLMALASSIWCNAFSFANNIAQLSIPESAELVIIYNSNRRQRMRDPVVTQLPEFTLVSIFSGPHLTENVYFRWNERFDFWKLTCHTKGQSHCTLAEQELIVPRWQLLVYAKKNDKAVMNQQLVSNLNAQQRMRCVVHKLFLVKQPLTCRLRCCVENCYRTARWTCTARGEKCGQSICLTHGQDICNGDAVVDIEIGMSGRRLQQAQVPPVDESSALSSPGADDEFDFDEDIDHRVLAPISMEDFVGDSDPAPLHSRQDVIPIYDVNRHIPAHYLWNNRYNVMRKWKRYSDVRTNAILQHIVSSTNDASVSLLYPEAQLFPRIFWCEKYGSVVGAIPSFMLNSTSEWQAGIASLKEHHNIRMRDGDLLTSKQNGYWHYLFDMKLNLALNATPSSIIFKRGFEFLEEPKKDIDVGTSSPQSHLPMNEAESIRRIKELASLLKKGKWTYFLTITVNDSETPGVREITQAIKAKANGDELLEGELIDAYLPFTLRAWERFVRIFLQELIMRNDSILGKVSNIFYRFEFQGAGAKGNKPHVHCGITLVDELDQVSVRRICCSSTHFHTSLYGADFTTLRDAGIFRDKEEYDRWCTIVACVNHHDCSKTQFRCMKATSADGTKICRYHRQPLLPEAAEWTGWFEEIPMPYPEDVYQLLQEMGLAREEYDYLLRDNKWVTDESLRAGKWHYFAWRDEFFLASIPLVSAICRSATNVDMCDRKFQVSYLVKYISGKEEHQLVDVTGTKEITEVRVTTEEHAHEKITSCNKIVSNKEKTNPHLGREVSLAEVVWFVLGFPYTYCNADFVHVSTLPLENRVGTLRWHTHSSKMYTANGKDLVAVQGRMTAGLPEWRRFTDQQQCHIEEYMKSPYYCDVTSSFNFRPPELLYFNDLQLYSECFIVVGRRECQFNSQLYAQRWFDGISRLVKLRACSVNKAISYTQERMNVGDTRATEMWEQVFHGIAVGNIDLVQRFVQPTQSTEVVSVISLVRPWDRCKFMTHICLSLGKYETEVNLFCHRTLRDAYIQAGLLSPVDCTTRADILRILRRYVIEDLRFHPISARQFGKYLKAAMNTLQDSLTDGVLGDYTPCLSNVMLKEQASNMLLEKEEQRKKNLVTALFEDMAVSGSLPINLVDGTLSDPLDWIPHIALVDGISDDAIREQTNALGCCVQAIDRFMDPCCRGLKFPCLVGRAGSGKSHVLKLAVAYAISKGLNVELMSWTSERARKLGGNHLHLVFPLEVSSANVLFSQSIAEQCLGRLQADALKQSLLKRTDVFVIEEIGMISAEYFVALDNVLRRVKGNSLPWGGTLMLSCGDGKQLPPIKGRPIWASVNMCTMMDVFIFTADVRARDDNLRWLNNECRRALSAIECSAVVDVVLEHCQFVNDWTAVPDIAVRIVPTKAAEIQVMQEYLRGRQIRSFYAVDEVQNGAVWDPAGGRVSKRLNTNCYEYDVCQLYENAIVRMTYNERHGRILFSQGQVAVVVQLPDDGLQFSEQRLRLRLAPPGIRHIDLSNIPPEWPEVVVGPRTTPPSIVGRFLQMGRRTQFPVRYYLCSTIHRIQGDTVPLLATEMSLSKREYKLWQKEQFAVLISRVQTCNDIIFVGNRTDTRAAIEQVLSVSSKWDTLIDHYLTELNIAVRPIRAPTIQLKMHPYLPLYRELPTASCGYVYLLASLVSCKHHYIDETLDLKKCLRLHNIGCGPEETRNTLLHPWGVFAFVCGFEQDYHVDGGAAIRQEFARLWNSRVNYYMSVEEAYNAVHQLAEDWIRRGCKLIVVKCGQEAA